MSRSIFNSFFRFIWKRHIHSSDSSKLPIVSIQNGSFYRRYPTVNVSDTTVNPAIFSHLTFSLPSYPVKEEHWAVVGPSNAGKTSFLEILRGKHVSLPPTARSFPLLAGNEVESQFRNSFRAIQYVGFDGEQGGSGKSGTRGAYLSARYESRREETDFSVLDYLRGNTALNPNEVQDEASVDKESLNEVIQNLRLDELLSMPISNLSNGQTRRAKIAKALLGKPLVLLLDEPFMGLDPPTTTSLSPLLHKLAEAASPRLVIALRPQDPMPDWITHVIQLGPGPSILCQGERLNASKSASTDLQNGRSQNPDHGPSILPVEIPTDIPKSRSNIKMSNSGHEDVEVGENIIEMEDVYVKYGEKVVIGAWEVNNSERNEGGIDARRRGLWWNVKRGERWGVFGPNGSGKTTLISLICSDHPLSYSLPIRIFGQGRLPQPGKPGISIFDIQARIGQSSPEIHAFFPRHVSLRQAVENAWADTFLGTPRLTPYNKLMVDASLRWFESELNPNYSQLGTRKIGLQRVESVCLRPTDWADAVRFGETPFSAQRVALFLRAILKGPELVILDEAFSGMDEYVRDKCMLFMTHGEMNTFSMREDNAEGKDSVIPTQIDALKQPTFKGLRENQALICVSHIKEEVPSILRKWICLPETGSGRPARFGHFSAPLDKDPKQWEKIWDI